MQINQVQKRRLIGPRTKYIYTSVNVTSNDIILIQWKRLTYMRKTIIIICNFVFSLEKKPNFYYYQTVKKEKKRNVCNL